MPSLPSHLLHRSPDAIEEPGVLYDDPAAPVGYRGYYAVDRELGLDLAVKVRASKMTPAVYRKIEELRDLLRDEARLRLIG